MPAVANADAPSAPSEGSLEAVGSAEAVRRALIEESAVALGRTWAESCRQDLHREGRRAAGGWPGTLREARARVDHALLVEMRCRKLPVITEPERELAARTTYASARTEWRKHLEPEEP